MTSNSDELDRVRNIVPSARRSIHSRSNNNSRIQNMGKYGLKSDLNLPDPGVDEVDNIMSKIPNTKPTPILNENKSRRYSYHVNEETDDDDDDDDDENILSKSSPPILLSYRMGFDTAIENMSGRSINSDSSSFNYNFKETSPNRQNNINRKPSSESNSKKKGFNAVLYIVLPIIACVASMVLYNMRTIGESEIDVYDEQSFYNDVKHLGIKYKVPDNAILKVRTGITTISEKHDTGSFIFTYNSENINYNPIKFDQFIEDIAAKASKYLRNDTREIHHLVINPTNLIVQTEKEFMNLYQKDVDERGVMLIKDVDDIPSHLAMAFHYYCDEFNPLVKKSAIFLTLNLAKCSNGSESKSTHDYIEKCLARKWNTIHQDKLGPLLTRVVNIVIDATRIL